MSVEWLNHKGHSLLYADFRRAKGLPEMLIIVQQAIIEMYNSRERVLFLADFRGVRNLPGFMEEVSNFKPQRDRVIKRTAVVPMLQANKIILGYYVKFVGNDTVKGFDSLEEGKEWLLQPGASGP